MVGGRSIRAVVVTVAACVVVGGCMSGGPARTSGSTPTSSAPRTSTPSSSAADGAQAYLDAVNSLCDALQPRVIAVTHGGSLNMPLAQYLAQLPAHTRLLAEFDRQVAAIPVPPAARRQAQALAAYIRYARSLDAKRLAAARRGAAAYRAEIRAESASAANDPSIAARAAAGFAESCDAR